MATMAENVDRVENPVVENPVTDIKSQDTTTRITGTGDSGRIDPAVTDAGLELYQSVSQSAVASLVLAFFGLTAFIFVPMLVLPIAGFVFALLAFNAFRKFPGEYLGRPMAYIGAAVCGITLLIAPIWHTYVYLTEVPEGYTRVDFGSFLSSPGKPDVPTEAAIDLNGEQIFVKGYIHPTSMDSLHAKRFVIVPDLGTCCFGNQPPLTHMIEVSLTGDQYATKSYRRQRLAGTFRVNQNLKPIEGLTGVFYQLKADVLK